MGISRGKLVEADNESHDASFNNSTAFSLHSDDEITLFLQRGFNILELAPQFLAGSAATRGVPDATIFKSWELPIREKVWLSKFLVQCPPFSSLSIQTPLFVLRAQSSST